MKRLLNYKEVAEKLGIAPTNVWELVYKDPTFPKRVNLGPRATRWVDEEIDQWFNSQRGIENVGSNGETETIG